MDIDVVVMWVDGSDPDWIKEKNSFSPVKMDDSNSVNRYRDWGLMKYWFRSIEKYAPWVHKVHFVTWGHLPDFLNTKAEKLNIVYHKDFMPAEYLPTFNCNSIETNVYRIPQLSDKFILFNDDCFLLKPMTPEKFFMNGLPCGYYGELPIIPNYHLGVYQHFIMNNISVVNRYFPKQKAIRHNRAKYYSAEIELKDRIRSFVMSIMNPSAFSGFKYYHAPNAYLKNVFETIWEKEPEIMDATGRARFRSPTDVSQCVALFWQLASGQFEPKRIDNAYFTISENNVYDICTTICSQSHDMLCINDDEIDVDKDSISARIRDAFESILPEKSEFEK